MSSNAGLGLHLQFAVNNLEVVGSHIENNRAGGIVVDSGARVNIEGNNIESNGGPAIVASNVDTSSRLQSFETTTS
jgi:parallel beta-helix repeat protein